jgi:uncharacterized membrane protein YqaE (UPF0057 family)
MLYLIAILFPPAAVLLVGKPVQALLNFVLTMALYFPGLIHAILVVSNFKADQRNERLVRELRRRRN